MAVVSCLVAALVYYIQTPHFARLAKQVVSRYVPADMGINADFSEFAIKLFPPGLSLRNPSVALSDNNILKLPAGSSVRAQRIDLNFQPFQMLSGDIRVHEVVISGGDLNLILPAGQPVKAKASGSRKLLPGLHWDELFQVRAEAVAIENTHVRLVLKTGESIEFQAAALRLGQWTGKGGLGYEVLVDVGRLEGSVFKGIPALSKVESVRASAQVNAAGATLNELVVKAEGLDAEAKVTLKGDILNTRNLALDGTARARGELARVIAALAPGLKEPIAGVATFNGGIQGVVDTANLARTVETLKATGRFGLEEARFGRWEVDRADLQGAWTSDQDGGELTIEKGVLQSPERRRVGGQQSAGGGKVTLGSFKLRPGRAGKEPMTIPIELERAHIHWLAAVALKDVYGLDFRVTGPLLLTYTPATGRAPWALLSKVDLKVLDFQLDNQRLGKTKPLHKVLDLKSPIELQGNIRIDPVGVHPEGVTVALPRTRLALGGKIDFKTGYDLKAQGAVNFEDIGQIAENDIRGVGSLAVHVHGPAARVFVDFDTELDQASYLKMDFGRFKGRVTWDDDPQDLLLTGLQIQQGRTRYTAEGKLELGERESVGISIRVPEGNMADLIRTFDQQTRDLWWFPRSLNGPVGGDVTVSGGLNMKKLIVSARMTGSNWEYLGEKLDRVSLVGGYDQGRYHISDFKATKHKGRINARIAADTEDSAAGEQRFDWEFHTEQMSINDFDWVAQLDVPIRGKISIDSVGSGKPGSIRSGSQILVTDMSVRGQGMAPSQITVRSAEGSLLVSASLEGGAGTFEFSQDAKTGSTGYLRGVARRFDFAPALMLLNSRSITDPGLAGTVSGEVNLSFRGSDWDRASGDLGFTEYRLAKTGSEFKLARPVSIRMNDGTFDLTGLTLKGKGSEASFDLRSREGNIRGSVTGDVDLSLVEFVTSSVSQASGKVGLDFALTGALKAPVFAGRAEVAGGTFLVPSVESPFENVTGQFSLEQNVLSVQKLEADLAGGHANASGKITLFADRFPMIDLKGFVGGSKIKVFPFQYAKVRGTIAVSGDRIPYLISGSTVVESALSREKVMQKRSGDSLKAARYTPPPTLARASDYPKFKLDIDVRADGNVVIQNDLFDAVAKGHLKVVNTLDTPRILGNAELIQGKMIFKDRVFQIQSAAAEFDNPTVINPRFTLTANTDVSGIKVQLYASGNIERWKAELSSNPVMPESEIISLLALGMSASDTRRLSASDRTVFEQGEAASLLLHSLDFNREVEEKTGVQIQLDETVNQLQGSSIFRPQSTAESAAAPKIVIRKKIADKVDLSYGSTVGVGAANQREVNAEVKVTPNLSVVGVWDDFETLDTKDKQTSYGLDVKLQKRFK